VTSIIDSFLAADTFTQFLTVGVLFWIGQKNVQSRPRLRERGHHVSAAVFGGDVLWSVSIRDMSLADELSVILLHAAVVAVLTLALAWILLPAGTLLFESFVVIPRQFCGRCVRNLLNRWQDRQARRRRKIERYHEQLEQERRRPEREKAERFRRQQEQARQDEAERRKQIRFETRVFYDRFRKELQDSFAPARLEEYFEHYMNEHTSADLVEKRAAHLRAMLDELSGGDSGRRRNRATPKSIRAEFQTRREEVQSAGFDEKTVAAMLASLAREEERAIREFAQS